MSPGPAPVPHSARWVVPAAIGFVIALAVLAVGVGPVSIAPAQVLAIAAKRIGLDFGFGFEPQQAFILESIRLPRVLLALVVGGGLGLCGATLQGIFRNPLVDPGLIGVSSGAALGAALALVVGPHVGVPATMVPLAAFGGGLLATLIVSRAGTSREDGPSTALVLAGIAVNALAGAGIGILAFVSTDAQLRNFTFWSFGSLSGATWKSLVITAPLIGLACLFLLRLARPLDALLLGEWEARHLGHDVARVRRIAIAGSALAVGAAVAVSGLIGFVGLVVPHIVRLVIGSRHAIVLPLSALLGGALLVASDIAARTVLAPAEVPIGVVTALVGGPLFLYLVRRNLGGKAAA